MDFNPDLELEELDVEPSKPEKTVPDVVSQQEATLVASNMGSSNDVVTVNNLLALTKTHMEDDTTCREVVNDLTEELNNSIQLMSIKELIEYLKVKLREREFHVNCIFKAYDFIQKSEFARETFIGSNRKERIIQATDRKRINGLLSILNE